MTRASKRNKMNLLIVIAFATSAILVSGHEFESVKLDRWDQPIQARSEPIEGKNQFYEGVFRARLDHFRPQNQERVEFVSFFLSMKHFSIYNSIVCCEYIALSCQCKPL